MNTRNEGMIRHCAPNQSKVFAVAHISAGVHMNNPSNPIALTWPRCCLLQASRGRRLGAGTPRRRLEGSIWRVTFRCTVPIGAA